MKAEDGLLSSPTSRFKRFRSVVVAVLGVVGALVAQASVTAPNPAWAARSSGHGHTTVSSPSGPMALISRTVQMNPKLPGVSCLTEDDLDQRVYAGSLSGTYVTTYQLCDLNTDGLTAGGIGLESHVSVVGQLSDLTITSPDGSAHSAVLMTQSISKGVTTSTYAVCYVPHYYISNDTGTGPLSGGTWQVTLSGQISSATWSANAQMTDVRFQQTYCPVSQQNLS